MPAQPEVSLVFYWFLKLVVVGPLSRLLFRPWVEGERHVPAHGPAILASNHLSFSDSIFLPLMLPRRITFPAKMEYFTSPGLTGRLKAAFFRGTGQIPIDRSGGSASAAAMNAGLEVLRRGELFGIYPEGTRSPDGRLYRGKTGVARLALEAGVPVIPVAMIDTDKAQPTGQKIPTIMRIGIRFGPALDFSRYAGMENDRVVLRAITDEIMYELARVSGQEYVDEYAAKAKKQMTAARAEEFRAAAQAQTAAAQAKAEEIVAAAQAQRAVATARVEEFVAAAKAESAAATAAIEGLVARASRRRDQTPSPEADGREPDATDAEAPAGPNDPTTDPGER